ncbi:DUF1653 domain-containing protein [Bacillus sonorensis]|uniref:DUF1653 domain-containing protein n=1 Tax=Bacillus sonorensis TaxID=119858 RepID=UPI002282261D|nr:DUF1653 domain-containing protein [Bacillus sonorensis]MCY8034148.1 DUF1653 domain-containing protein [Bacillus sonorensis]
MIGGIQIDTFDFIGYQFKHYKGDIYKVIGEVVHTETGDKLVVYEGNDGILWARPKDMFFGKVVVHGKEINRFTKIN